VRTCVQRAASIAAVGVAGKVRIGGTLFEQRRKVGQKFGTQEVPIRRTAAERGAQRLTEDAIQFRTVTVGELVFPSTRNRQAAETARASSKVDLPVPFLPTKNVTGFRKLRSSPLRNGRLNG
jgi:hypothetical protein